MRDRAPSQLAAVSLQPGTVGLPHLPMIHRDVFDSGPDSEPDLALLQRRK